MFSDRRGMDRATLARKSSTMRHHQSEPRTVLGLSVLFGIVHSAAGNIWVDSKPCVHPCFGSTCRAWTRVPPPVAAADRDAVNAANVLLVEDIANVRRGRALDACCANGYRVLRRAIGGDEASLVPALRSVPSPAHRHGDAGRIPCPSSRRRSCGPPDMKCCAFGLRRPDDYRRLRRRDRALQKPFPRRSRCGSCRPTPRRQRSAPESHDDNRSAFGIKNASRAWHHAIPDDPIFESAGSRLWDSVTADFKDYRWGP